MARTGQPSRERVASTQRALAILDVLAADGPLGTNELARRLGTTASTISRQLGTLAESRLVERVAESGHYRLGVKLVQLANVVLLRLDIRAVVRPHLEALVEEVDETATLSVPADPDPITVDVVPSERHIQSVSSVGRPSIAHATSAGKVMLAFTSQRPQLPLDAYTKRTIVDPQALEAELEQVRRRGWADAYQEREPELNAIAVPVWSGAGELVGIIALQGPTSRFGRQAARSALPLLLERAEAISRELGAK